LKLKKHHIIYNYTLLLIVFFFHNLTVSQTFVRIESIAGLGVLEENNGVAVADYDGDLDLDIFVVALEEDDDNDEKTHSRLFRNNNDGTFTDVTTEAGLGNLLPLNLINKDGFFGLTGYKFAASWGDYDNDGFPDLFFTHLKRIQLFRNQGDGTFLNVTVSAGFEQSNECHNMGATWVDYNNDSFLDVFLADWNGCGGNSLYKNNGDGTFENTTLESGIALGDSLESFVMLPFDFNNDGWQDFYISNDLNDNNTLFINQDGVSFVEQASTYGIDSMLDDMGIAIGDYNNDGDFDLFTTGIDENSFYENDGSNNFTEESQQVNVLETDWSWGCKFADFDLDGDEDLFIVNGYRTVGPQNNFYYKNLNKEGSKGFQDVSSDLRLDELTTSVEVLDFDYDNDGDLDVFVTNSDRASFFYENLTSNYGATANLNWFKVSLEGTTSNRDAYGAKISVVTDSGSYVRYHSGVGFVSQSIKPVHFGLNEVTQINEVQITWPSGLVETHKNINANTHIRAIEGKGYEVLTIMPSEKITGCTDPNACNYNPLAVASDGNCLYFTSDSTINGSLASGFNNEEDYIYGLDTNTITWTVEGGELVSGQGTNTITIRWGIGVVGKITAFESAEDCVGEVKEINVNLSFSDISANVSIARLWNEALLEAIRNDYARPTVHARNLFHTSVALYDAWAMYDEKARPYLVGNIIDGFKSDLEKFVPLGAVVESQEKAMSFAAYRLLTHRFRNSPNNKQTLALFNSIMDQLGYDINETATNYISGKAAALGNYIADTLISFGNVDSSREATGYDNAFYSPVNTSLILSTSDANIEIENPNRWQPLTFNTFIDQSGNLISGDTPSFLSPEWGSVTPFALSEENKTIFEREENSYTVYHDPGMPPELDILNQTNSSDLYKWNFSLVSIWSSHLDPSDGVLWDISPKNIGNIDIGLFPKSFSEYANFYNEIEGGDISLGRSINPKTGQAYETQMVPRADYTRVLAEFWADGPDSETPPGHWFTILNYVNDHELFTRKFNGEGEELNPLEWDVKAYFILSGAMHDAAIAAWGIKGWYDYIRPVSAIRYMASLGQSTNQNLSNYHVGGIPLKEGYIEVIEAGDELSGMANENVDKIKLYAWKGHDAIGNAATDVAGVGWILAQDWFPYQRPSFVTPPFAGYLSGHSTYSRAAAEVMTLITGDEYFPGGLGEFTAKKDDFLVFEKGPSVDVKLQWATYRDASDQTSLSRIWGGIHPPADDVLGRIIGEKVGVDAYNFALPYFTGGTPIVTGNEKQVIYPNPVDKKHVNVSSTLETDTFTMFDMAGRNIPINVKNYEASTAVTTLELTVEISVGLYVLKVNKKSYVVLVRN